MLPVLFVLSVLSPFVFRSRLQFFAPSSSWPSFLLFPFLVLPILFVVVVVVVVVLLLLLLLLLLLCRRRRRHCHCLLLSSPSHVSVHSRPLLCSCSPPSSIAFSPSISCPLHILSSNFPRLLLLLVFFLLLLLLLLLLISLLLLFLLLFFSSSPLSRPPPSFVTDVQPLLTTGNFTNTYNVVLQLIQHPSPLPLPS